MIEYKHWVVEVNGHVMIWVGEYPDNESMEVPDELPVELLFGPVPETLANAFFEDWMDGKRIGQNIGDVYRLSPLSGQHIFVVIGGKTLDVFSMLSFKERPNLIALSCYNIGLEGTFYITKRAYGCFLRRVQTENDQWIDRHPRLRRAIQWVAILSKSEAVSTHEHAMWAQNFGCEAANHYGGCMKVAHDAWKCRNWSPKHREAIIRGWFVNRGFDDIEYTPGEIGVKKTGNWHRYSTEFISRIVFGKPFLTQNQKDMVAFLEKQHISLPIQPIAFVFSDDDWIDVLYSDGSLQCYTVENTEYRMKKYVSHAE